MRAAQFERMAHARRGALDESLVFYESFAGNGMLCNPEAIFRALLAAPDLGHLTHVWALSDLELYAGTIAEFADDPRVSFVRHDSLEYHAAAARAKYLINNATFPTQWGKRPGQVYLNTWHGTPLKAMGYDIPGGALNTRNIVRNFLSADYLLGPNDETVEMYLSAYRMRNILPGRIVAEGTPRVDKQFASPARQDDVRNRLRAAGVEVSDDRELLLYAPTWRGDFYAPTNDIRLLRARIETLNAAIDTSRYHLVLKVHQQVYKHAVGQKELRPLLIPNEIPTNDVLAVTDALITDYSSIFVDFMATGRPVLFFMPDLEEYAGSRGLNVPPEELPGPVCRDLDELAAALGPLGSGTQADPAVVHKDAYDALRERFCPREDGGAAARVIDVVFRGRLADRDVREDAGDGRPRLLVHLGGMLNNGITSAGLCLLDNIDHDRFDVSVTFQMAAGAERLRQIGRLHPRARLLPRMGGMNGSKLRVTPLVAVSPRPLAGSRMLLERGRDLLADEWRRCYGDARFDHVVDFSGYAPFWPKLFTARSGGSLTIWLHNDIRAELDNPGRPPHLRASLEGMIQLYAEADHLVSVSQALDEVNRTKLADVAPPERFTYARNTINYQAIEHLAYGRPVGAVRSVAEADRAGDDTLQAWVDTLMSTYGVENVIDEVQRRATVQQFVPTTAGMTTFVTAGRLSPEKNHARLIRAFDRVHQSNPDTRLVILGHGPLQEKLETLIQERGLARAVTLAGHQPNPYGIFANSDCFVLSSDYEGQPMVLLEALVLGLPIVTTSFDSVHGALPAGTGLVVERDVAALAAGLRAFLKGTVPTGRFDPAAYNAEATAEFLAAVGATRNQ